MGFLSSADGALVVFFLSRVILRYMPLITAKNKAARYIAGHTASHTVMQAVLTTVREAPFEDGTPNE